ncbi:hypothetical protein JCM11491_005811 [Sporobolomyces phaffii]
MPSRETVTIKVTHRPSDTTRKLVLPEGNLPAYASLVPTILARFSLEGPAELVYTDEDGDVITLSDADEFTDLWFAAADDGTPIRFELRQLGSPTPVIEPTSPPEQESESAVTAAEPDARDEQRGTIPVEHVAGPAAVEVAPVAHETTTSPEPVPIVADPPRATILFEDPDDTPLPSTSDLARDQASEEFPSTSSAPSSSAHPGTFPDDPLDLPLPSSFDESLPFSNLPNSLSSFLASLGTRSSTFSSTLASALSPTSPHSPTSRLSTILSASTLDDIPLVASSLVQMGSEFAEIAKDVAMGVRREADEIRGEFSKLRDEVETERARFREEIRDAFEQATPTEDEPAVGEPDVARDGPTPVAVPRSPTLPQYAEPPSPRAAPSAGSVRSSIAPSSVDPSSSSRSHPDAAPSPLNVSRETSRLLHKQAKQARKDYRAAVRQARADKKRARCATRSESGAAAPVEETVPEAMPSKISMPPTEFIL